MKLSSLLLVGRTFIGHHEEGSRRLITVHSLLEVIRHAARRLRRSPGYSIPVVLSLALGIGLNTAVFAVVSNVLLRPLPFPNQAELVTAGMIARSKRDPTTRGPQWQIFPNDLLAWRNDTKVFTSVAAFVTRSETVEGNAGPEYVAGGGGSANLLSVLGVQVLRGRWFGLNEEGTGYVVIGYDLWQRQFAADSAIIGRTLRVHDEPKTIIGVMPRSGALPLDAQFWLPTTFAGQLVARPKPGLSLATVARELETIGPGLANLRKGGYTVQVVVEPLHDQLFGSAGPALRLVTAAAALLLLIACANIANLSLARSLEQGRETAVRIALGASRTSLAALVFAENLLLALVGAVGGAVLAVWATRILVAIGSDDVMRVSGISVDVRSVVFAGALAVLTALVVSLGPVLAAAHRDVRTALGQSPRQGGSNAFRTVRRTLVVAQLTLTLLLMSGAGLLVRSVGRLTRPDHLGFSPHGVVLASIPLYGRRYLAAAERDAFGQRVIERVKGLPFVQSVGLGPPPLVGGHGDGLREGFNSILYYPDTTHGSQTRIVWMKFIDEGYLDTYRIRLVAGRAFQPADDSLAPPVALLNHEAVKMFFGDRVALDQPLVLKVPFRRFFRDANTPPRVVGIVADVLQRDLAIETEPEIYLPQRQAAGSPTLNMAIRLGNSSAAAINAMRQAIRAADPHVTASRLETMDDVVSASLARHTFLLWLLGALAGLAVALSMLGLYAIVSYLVAQRTFEIGLRIALGAQRHDILGLVLGEAGMLVGTGLIIGIPMALALSRFISSFLYEVKAHDVMTFAAAPLLLSIVAIAAAYRPARRAVALDPAQTLRAD